MELAQEWKCRWPILSTFSAPLLIPNKRQETVAFFGPLIFSTSTNNSSSSSTTLLQSPDLAPRLPPSYPQLSCSRFIHNYCGVPQSVSGSSIPSLVGTHQEDPSASIHGFNSLQLLQIPDKGLTVAFFPKGENYDQVGVSLLCVRDGVLRVEMAVNEKCHHQKHQRIKLLLVNPQVVVGDLSGHTPTPSRVGFLIVCTDYSVCWYGVRITTTSTSSSSSSSSSVSLDYMGCADAKVLRGSAVVSACWSPHLKEECLVLLENGDMLLFDVTSFRKGLSMMFPAGRNNRVVVVREKMRFSLTDMMKISGGWFKCEFSWHPRIVVASHPTEVFLVDLRMHGVVCSSLLKLDEMLSTSTSRKSKKDGFLALHSDGGFCFTVTTENLLLLCDVRKPHVPLLRWSHGIENPRYVTACRLSDLRAHGGIQESGSAAAVAGHCITVGSFWDNDFSFFCYGPNAAAAHGCPGEINHASLLSSKASISGYYAWGLPSKLPMSDFPNCGCGSCAVREEFTTMSLPPWIDWRQTKHHQLVLGFGILDPHISAHLSSHSKSNNFLGGFTMIRLTSSGKLQAQPYHVASESSSTPHHFGKNIASLCSQDDDGDNLLYDRPNNELDGEKKFKYIKLESLGAFSEGNLEKHILETIRKKMEDSCEGTSAPKKQQRQTELGVEERKKANKKQKKKISDDHDMYLEESESEAFSIEARLKRQYNKVVQLLPEHLHDKTHRDDHDDFVSLADDEEPAPMLGKQPSFHDMGCPVQLEFADCTSNFGPKELQLFQRLEKGNLDFQKRLKAYQDYISRQDKD